MLNSYIPFLLNVKFSRLMGIKAWHLKSRGGWLPCPWVSVSYCSHWLVSSAGAVQVCPAHMQPLTFSSSASAHQMESLQLVVLIVLNSTLFMSLLNSFTKEKLPLNMEWEVTGCARVGAAFWPASGWKADFSTKLSNPSCPFYFLFICFCLSW